MIRSAITTILLLGVLSGCGISANNYQANREALRGSPQLRQQSLQTCIANQHRKSMASRQNLARLMNTTASAAPRTVCRRLQSGITTGRLSHGDVDSAMRGQMTPNLVRVLQGR